MPFDSNKPGSRKLPIILGVVLCVVVLAIGAGWIALPHLVTARVSASIATLSQRLPGELAHGDIALDGTWTVDIGSLEWTDGSDWSLRARELQFTVDPLSFLFGRPRLVDADIGELDLRLGDPAKPFATPAEVLTRVMGLLEGGEAGGGGGPMVTGSRARPLPRLRIGAVRGDVHMAGPWSLRVTGGRVEIGAPAHTLDAMAVGLDAELRFRLADGVDRALRVEGRADQESGIQAVQAQSEPPLAFKTDSGEASVAGISWKPGEVQALSPAWSVRNRFSVSAEKVAFRWEDIDSGVKDGSDKTRDPVLALPQQLQPLVVGRRIVEVEFFDPVADLELPTVSEPSVPVPEAGTRKAAGDGKDGAFRRDLERMTRGITRSLAAFRANVSELAGRLPSGRVLVHGASVRYLLGGRPVPGPEPSLANIDAFLARSSETGRVAGRLTFECPEAASGANEVRFDLDPAGGSGSVSVLAGHLPLYPYRGMLPGWFQVEPRTVLRDCRLGLDMDGAKKKLGLEGKLSVEGVGIFLPGLASSPLKDLDLGMKGAVTLDADAGSLALKDGLLGVGDLRMPVELTVSSMPDRPRVRLEARVERLKAQDLLESIPKEMIPALKGVRVSGSFAASLSLDVDTRDMSLLKFDFQPDVADLKVLDPGSGANLDLLRHEFFHRIEESGGRVVKRFIGPSSPAWVSLDDVPGYLIGALTTSEDALFFKHHGFSLGGIRRSLRVNLERGGFYQGASTLSQQLVKNLFLSSEKTLARKLQEAFITWQLERFLSKDRILELYLNVVEWGPDSHGLGEAAMHYFGKKPSELGLLEAGYLVSIIPNPRGNHRHFEEGAVPLSFERRVKRLLKEMARRGKITPERLETIMNQRIRFVLTETPEADDGDAGYRDIPDDEFSGD